MAAGGCVKLASFCLHVALPGLYTAEGADIPIRAERMPDVEVSREDGARATVFEAIPGTVPPVRYVHLVYTALMVVGIVALAETMGEPTATMLLWLAGICAMPVLVLWGVTLLEAARRRAVRIAVTSDGLLLGGNLYPHETIRDLALYAPSAKRPLFIAHIAPVTPEQHRAELELVTGAVGVEDEGGKPKTRRRSAHGYRLVMHRRQRQPAIVLVRGLTLSGGETIFAALAAELRKHSR